MSNEIAATDNDLNEEELLLLMFIKLAPADVRHRILQRIRESISIKAADAAQDLMTRILVDWEDKSVSEMLEALKPELISELQGPTAPVESSDFLKELLGAIFGVSPEAVEKVAVTRGVENGYQVPTPGCSCARCTYVRSKEQDGIRIREDGSEESTKDMN